MLGSLMSIQGRLMYMKKLGSAAKGGEEVGIGTRQPGLCTQRQQGLEQLVAPALVEMGRDLVKEQDRKLSLSVQGQVGLRQNDAHQEGLLPAGGAGRGRGRRGGLAHQEIASMDLNRLREALLEDKDLLAVMTPAEIEDCFSAGYHLKHVDAIFQRVFGRSA